MRKRLAFTPVLFLFLSPLAGRAQEPSATAYVAATGATAEQLVAAMKSGSLELRAARQRLLQAEGRLRQRALWLNPRVEVEDKTDRLSANRGVRELEFALVQPLELGGKRAARIRLGEAEREMIRFEIADLERRLAAELRLRVGEALAAAGRLQALDEALELQQRMQRAVVLRVSAGDAARFEMALSDAEAARLEAERQALLSQLESLMAGIKVLVGLPQAEPLRLREQELAEPGAFAGLPRQEAGLAEKALAGRPDLQAARWRAVMAQSGVRLAEASAFPDVGVIAGFKQDRAGETSGMTARTDWLFRFGVVVGLPVFNRNQGARQETAALLAEARLAADFAEQTVRRDVAVALRRLELAENSLRLVSGRLIPQTESAARIARLGYELGEWSLQQLILEQRRLVEARNTLLQAGLEVYRARVELLRAVGE